MGMGVTGLSIPVGWAVYITNFVFWVGIGARGHADLGDPAPGPLALAHGDLAVGRGDDRSSP